MESLSVGLSSSPFQSPDAKNHRPTLKPIHQFHQNYYVSNSFSYFQTQILSRKKTTCSPLTQSSIHLSNTPSSTYFSNLPKTHFPSLKNNHSFLQSRLKSYLFFLCSGLAFPLCCFASEIVVPTEEVPRKINLEAVLVSIDDFFNRNPFFVAGVTFIWLVVIPLTQEFLQKYKFISAINAFRKLRDDPSTQLLDIRGKKSLQYLGSPNLRILCKSVVQVEYSEGDDEGFVKKVLDELAEPESTAICVIDKNQKFKMTSNTIDPNPDSRSAGRRKDPAWKYHSLVNPNDLNTFKCNFCGKLTKGGVYRAKQHLAGGYRNAEICSKCPPHVRDEIIEFMSKKKGKNDFDDMPDFDDIDTLGDDVDDEMDVGAFQNRGKRPMQGQASSMQQKKQRQQQRGPLDLFLSAKPKVSNQKDAKGKQTTIESHVNKELRENACVWFSRWMYEAGIPFNAVNYPSFKPMMEAVGRAGPGMKPPSFHEVRVPYLKKEVEHTKEIMKSHREEWARYGCTIMCDGWKDKRDRSLLNFLVNSPKGSVFIESIDTSSYAKDGMKLYQLLDRFVEEIGEANVVQVVTDNASANVLAGEFLMTKHKNLYWTPCAAHCLDLMLEDIFKIPRLKSTFQKACSVNGYLYSSAQVLNMMRSFTQKREMLRPGKTRFATAFLTLSRFHKQKANLRKMFTSEEWTNSRFAKETRGKQAAQTVLQESFWKNILFALKVSGPLVKVLRVVDNEDKPAMPYIYEAMDRAKEAIAKSFDDESKYEKIFEIIDERWNVQLHRPLHAAGYYLNPAFFYSNESIREDNEVIEGLYACIERLVPTAEVQDKLSKELSFYKNSEGLFGKQICIRGRNQLSPVEWWSQFGTGTPNLQKFAMKICSLTCSSSGCERNWSIFEHLHSKKRNRLEQRRLNDLVFVKYNRALRRRFNLRKSIDPISLDEIDESNEWLLGTIDQLDDSDNELVHEGDDLTWADVSRASGVEKAHYATRSSNAPTLNLTKSRRRATSTSNAPIEPDEDEEEERYDVEEEDIGDDVSDDGNMEMLDLDVDNEDDF